jgi:hypothetical protein
VLKKIKEVFLTKTDRKVKGFEEISFSKENLNVDQSITVIPPPVLDRTVGLA